MTQSKSFTMCESIIGSADTTAMLSMLFRKTGTQLIVQRASIVSEKMTAQTNLAKARSM